MQDARLVRMLRRLEIAAPGNAASRFLPRVSPPGEPQNGPIRERIQSWRDYAERMGTVDEAISEVPSPSREVLQHVIDIARRLAPEAEDGVSYGMPALRLAGKPFVGVVAAAKHLSLFPFSPAAIESAREDLADYSVSKGTVRFSAEHPLPDEVIERILRARLAEIAGA